MTKRILVVFSFLILTIGAAVFGEHVSIAQTNTPRPAATPPPDDEDDVIRVDTEAVNVLFTAQDRNRRLLTDLKQGDVQLFENGTEQEIIEFSRQVDLPMSLSILIDTSASQERTLPQEKEAAIAFLESVVRPEKDEVSILSFTGETTLEQGMTNNLVRLRRAVERIKFTPPSGYIGGGVSTGTPPISGGSTALYSSTALWDAIWVTGEEVLGPAPERTRRAIILLTDGVNTGGQKKLDEAVQAALRAEAVIYTIGIGDNYYDGVDKGTLNRISERSGGRAYFPHDERELRKAFQQIEEEMRSQYLIAYEPVDQKRDGSYRTIEIRLINPELKKQKVKITHRQGYFAKSETK
jgi:VWFA-related protein